MKNSFEPPFTPKNADFVEIVRSKGDKNQAIVAVMDMRNRQQSRRNKSTDTEEGDPRCLLCSYYDDFIACFSCPLRRLYCLFLMSITATLLPISHLHYGDYCLIFISLGPDNLNKIGIFRGEGGLK